MVYAPVTLRPDQTLADAKALQERYRITGFPVVDDRGVVVGIVTNRDMRFATRRPHAGQRDDDAARTSRCCASRPTSARPRG